jgi:hypothetical protein
MSDAINIVLLLAIGGAASFFYQYLRRTSQLVTQMKKDIKALQHSLQIERTEESSSLPPQPEFRIAIEIIDPLALATRESKLAPVVASIAPNYVTRRVYTGLQQRISLAMEQGGIDANVTILML